MADELITIFVANTCPWRSYIRFAISSSDAPASKGFFVAENSTLDASTNPIRQISSLSEKLYSLGETKRRYSTRIVIRKREPDDKWNQNCKLFIWNWLRHLRFDIRDSRDWTLYEIGGLIIFRLANKEYWYVYYYIGHIMPRLIF